MDGDKRLSVLVVPTVLKVPIRKACSFNEPHCLRRDNFLKNRRVNLLF